MFKRLAIPVFLLALPVLAAAQVAFTAYPRTASGNDATHPDLATVIGQVRALRSGGGGWPQKGVVVTLQNGVHYLPAPLALDAGLSGTPDAPLVFTATHPGLATLSGGRPVSGWAKVTDDNVLSLLKPAARGHVMQADLSKAGVTDYGTFFRRSQDGGTQAEPLELVYRGQIMPLARWPNTGFARIASVTGDEQSTTTFQVQGIDAATLAKQSGVQAVGYWYYDWAYERVPIQSVAPDGTVTVQSPPPRYGIRAKQRVFIQNALSELDSPGEWYLDRGTGILYFWPPADVREGDVEVTVLPSIVVANNASHVQFKGLVFENVRGDAVVVNGGSGVRIEMGMIRNAGNRGAVLAGDSHAIVDTDIHDTGDGGVVLTGGDRNTLTPGNLLVQGNQIWHFSRLAPAGRPAVWMNGVGNIVRSNFIHDGKHSAILFFGNDHLIENNDISRVVTEAGDAGAIYIGRSWSARGNRIRTNFFHDINNVEGLGARGIYLDDQQSGVEITYNLFVRVPRAVFIAGGRDNIVQNNEFISSAPGVYLDARGTNVQKAMTDDPNGPLRRTLTEVPTDGPLYRSRYPALVDLLNQQPGYPMNNRIVQNVYFDTSPQLNIDPTAQKVSNIGKVLDAQLEGSIAPAQRTLPTQFKLQDGSPALAAGFVALPLKVMSCTAQRWTAQSTPDCPSVRPSRQ
jgi:hypothetical protein